jgi:redox-sensitive bicupin YhaK (pirin superfamily)
MPETAVLFGEVNEILLPAGGKGIAIPLHIGNPVREPVAWYGPIVMNTEEELRAAFTELKEGTFIRKG